MLNHEAHTNLELEKCRNQRQFCPESRCLAFHSTSGVVHGAVLTVVDLRKDIPERNTPGTFSRDESLTPLLSVVF